MNNKQLLILLTALSLCQLTHADSQFNLGLGAQQLTLLEKDKNTGQRLVKEQGWVPSVVYNLSWPMKDWLFDARIQQSYGTIHYDGQTQAPANTPHQTDSTQTITKGAISVGRLFGQHSEIYTGLQLQEMVRDVANRDNVYGATEIYDEVWWRLGLKQLFINNNRQQLLLWGEWQTPLYAHSSVNFRVNYDNTNITLKQGIGAAAGLHYQQAWSGKHAWFMDMNYYFHRYHDSSTAALTSQGQATSSYAQQPPISFAELGIYTGVVWHWH